MNSSQMMITMAAMALLSMIILRTNNSFLNTSEVLINAKINIIAISLATSIIEEAKEKAFDENSIANPVTSTSSLTVDNLLGPEASETRIFYDDFDDYHNFSFVDTFVVDSLLLGFFNLEATVDYVTPANPDVAVTTPTWHKRLEVTVTGPAMTDTVRMSTIYSYWYFR
jgi:hypothetical protein